jgi:hypothetical protein
MNESSLLEAMKWVVSHPPQDADTLERASAAEWFETDFKGFMAKYAMLTDSHERRKEERLKRLQDRKKVQAAVPAAPEPLKKPEPGQVCPLCGQEVCFGHDPRDAMLDDLLRQVKESA